MRFLCSHCEEILEREEFQFNESIACDHCRETTLVPASRLALGVVFGDFVIMELIGEERICTRHLAHQLSLRREVVLAVLKRELEEDRRYVQQFVNDARIMARLIHPNIVHAYAIGEEEGINYAAIEHVRGRNLQSMLYENHHLPLCHALDIARQLADAIDYAWVEQHILHRDIKPGNIIWTVTGTAKLQGFRMARTAKAANDEQEADEIVGTPPYLCPETLLGAPMDVRSDIYSLGATLYQLITGQIPFTGSTAEEIAWKHLEEPVLPPSAINAYIPHAVSDIVLRMMEKDVDARYPTAADLVADLADAIRKLDTGQIGPVGPGVPAETRRNVPVSAPLAEPPAPSPQALPSPRRRRPPAPEPAHRQDTQDLLSPKPVAPPPPTRVMEPEEPVIDQMATADHLHHQPAPIPDTVAMDEFNGDTVNFRPHADSPHPKPFPMPSSLARPGTAGWSEDEYVEVDHRAADDQDPPNDDTPVFPQDADYDDDRDDDRPQPGEYTVDQLEYDHPGQAGSSQGETPTRPPKPAPNMIEDEDYGSLAADVDLDEDGMYDLG